MAAKGVYVSLRTGVDHATLPDNRSMRPGAVYLISLDDFQKLSRSVRESVVSVEGIETNSYVVNHAYNDFDVQTDSDEQYLDLSTDGGDDEDLAESGWKGGQVLQGLNGEAFKLCKVDGGASAGDVLVYADEAAALVTLGDEGTFAGVLLKTTVDGEWGWVQTEGVAVANAENGIGAGDNLKVKDDGKFDTTEYDAEDPDTWNLTVATALNASGTTSLVEVALRSSRARNRYVKRPNLFYPGQ